MQHHVRHLDAISEASVMVQKHGRRAADAAMFLVGQYLDAGNVDAALHADQVRREVEVILRIAVPLYNDRRVPPKALPSF